jgi:hypothetical protein
MAVLDAAAALVALLCVALSWAARGNLNVDGAAYLDLAHRLIAGDVAAFVQGYWSPVYPMLLAAVVGITGATGGAAIAAAHALNACIALTAVAMLWREARTRQDVTLGVLTLTAFLLASARTVRVDAVTPDLLLLLVVMGFGIELLRTDGSRPARLGLWAGAAFLVKTSVWPWLIVAAIVGANAARNHAVWRRRLAGAVAIAALPVVLWTAAVSADEGRVTLGSSGRLNACWYLLSCDGRTPDTHQGEHREYHDWLIGAESRARVATFVDTRWTYAPWSDPSAWQAGLLTQERQSPTSWELAAYAGTQLGLVIGIWMAFLIVGVMLPTALTTRAAPGVRALMRSPAGAAILLGALGVLQFVAVHAEPRLIAPFVMLLALGFISWRLGGVRRPLHLPVAGVGLAVALLIGTWHLRDQAMVSASSALRTSQIEGTLLPMRAPHRVAVVGPVLPMMPDLYRARAVVVAQVIQPDPAGLAAWPPAAQAALAGRLRGLGVTTLWISRGRDAYRIVPLEPAVAP